MKQASNSLSRKIRGLTLLSVTFMVASCAKKAARWSGVALDAGLPSSVSLRLVGAVSAAPLRFIAEHHKLDVVTSESELQKSWAAMVAFCGTIQCEIVSSSITTRTGELDPSGAISLRVVPGDLQKLLDHLQAAGQIATHTTERLDKTPEVIDTEAKIKNLTSFRDNLRGMLSKPSATVKDLVEIQQQLTETQSELDSETAQRKILANETEKIAVDISFRVTRTNERHGAFSEISDALRESGSVLADSTASLITVIVAAIPWLILIVPAMWLIIRGLRRLRRNRKGPASQTLAVEPSQKA